MSNKGKQKGSRPRKRSLEERTGSVFTKKKEEIKEILPDPVVETIEEDPSLEDNFTEIEEEEVDIDFSNIDDEEINIISLSELLPPSISEEEKKNLENQIEEEKQFQKQEQIVQLSGTVKHYKVSSPEENKIAQENIRNQIMDFLMVKKGMSFINSRAMLESLLQATGSLEIIRDNLMKEISEEQNQTKVIEEKKTIEGVSVKSFKSQVNYY